MTLEFGPDAPNYRVPGVYDASDAIAEVLAVCGLLVTEHQVDWYREIDRSDLEGYRVRIERSEDQANAPPR